MLENTQKKLKDELLIKENKIIYNSDQDVTLWQGQTILLKMYTPLKKLNVGNQFGVVLEEDLLDSSIFLIQNLFCPAYEECLVLRLVNLNYHDAPVKLTKETLIGKIFSFD